MEELELSLIDSLEEGNMLCVTGLPLFIKADKLLKMLQSDYIESDIEFKSKDENGITIFIDGEEVRINEV